MARSIGTVQPLFQSLKSRYLVNTVEFPKKANKHCITCIEKCQFFV